MRRIVLLGFALFILSGCGRYFIPLEGKLENGAIQALRPLSSDSPKIAVFLEKYWDRRIVSQKANGATCGHGYTEIPLGPALSQEIIQGLGILFPAVKVVDRPERPDDFFLVQIDATNLEIRFEFSAWGGCDPPWIDQARISVALRARITNLENQSILDRTYYYEEKEVGHEIPPVSRTGVMEKCLHKAAVKFVKELREAIKPLS
jgi:hypothetical protein